MSLGPPGEVATDADGGGRDGFCRFLRAERDRASLTIEEIARVTRIPEHSLRRLEAGEFEELPGDVFVRGFLRSYARCVGLDADEVVRRYAECGGIAPAPVASDVARVAAEQAAAMAAKEDGGEVVGVGRGIGGSPGLSGSSSGLSGSSSGLSASSVASGSAGSSVSGTGTGTGTGLVSGSGSVSGSVSAAGDGVVSASRSEVAPEVDRVSVARSETAPVRQKVARGRKGKKRRHERKGRRAPTVTGAGQRVGGFPQEMSAPLSRAADAGPSRAVAPVAAGQQPARAVRAQSAVGIGRARSGAGVARAGGGGTLVLGIAVAVLVIAAIATMSHLLRRPDEARTGEGAGEMEGAAPARSR